MSMDSRPLNPKLHEREIVLLVTPVDCRPCTGSGGTGWRRRRRRKKRRRRRKKDEKEGDKKEEKEKNREEEEEEEGER